MVAMVMLVLAAMLLSGTAAWWSRTGSAPTVTLTPPLVVADDNGGEC